MEREKDRETERERERDREDVERDSGSERDRGWGVKGEVGQWPPRRHGNGDIRASAY